MGKLTALKNKHEKAMNMYAKNVKEHVDRYGDTPCDYLLHRQKMENYHRGAWNALNDAEKIIGEE